MPRGQYAAYPDKLTVRELEVQKRVLVTIMHDPPEGQEKELAGALHTALAG